MAEHPEPLTAIVNGAGNFGRLFVRDHFVQKDKRFHITVLNDNKLTPVQIKDLLVCDRHAKCFPGLKVSLEGNELSLHMPDGREDTMIVTHGIEELSRYIGTTDFFFECSGESKNDVNNLGGMHKGRTQVVFISETAYNADATLVYGFNHETFRADRHRFVSYGSCTVNPGVLLLNFLNKKFGVEWASVDVVHNIQQYRLDKDPSLYKTLFEEKFCTLERSGQELLPFLRGKFIVPYNVIPWGGSSKMYYKVRLKKKPSAEVVVDALQRSIGPDGELHRLIGMVPSDTGPSAHDGTPYCAVIVEDKIKMVGDMLCFACYFDNEASGTQLGRLARYIAKKLG